jgi:transmembrane sensor
MLNKRKINKRLIARYLSGNCSTVEQSLVEQWIGASAKNAELFKQYKAIWSYTAPVDQMPQFDPVHALDKVNRRIDETENTSIRFSPQKHTSKTLQFAYRYAASIAAVIVIAFGSYMLINTEPGVKINTVTAEARILDPVTLPDGSHVFMNAGSEMEFPEAFGSHDRHISLDGEAYFEVVHDPSRPFIVTVGNIGVKVLGTSFNIKENERLNAVEVSIMSGKVLFYSFDVETGSILEQLVLNAGQKGVYDKASGMIARNDSGINNCIAWKSGRLEFNNTPLPMVFKALENTYDLHFVCERDFGHLVLTARFDQEAPENILETLQLIFGFQIEQSGSQIRIF